MIKIVFLDVGGTLIRPEPSVGAIYASVAARHGVKADGSMLEQRFRTLWKEEKKRRRPINEAWWKELVPRVMDGLSFKDSEVFFRDLYAEFENPAVWHVFPDVRATLTELKKKGLRLAVASNWDDRLPKLLNELNLTPYFEKQFISFQTGFLKPDPNFFHHALKEMNGHALEALHVGDDEEEDVLCAEKAGLRAYLLDRKSRPLNSRMLASLEELLVRI